MENLITTVEIRGLFQTCIIKHFDRQMHCIDGPSHFHRTHSGDVTVERWALFGHGYPTKAEWQREVLRFKRAVLIIELRRTIQLKWRNRGPMMQTYLSPEGKGGKKHKEAMMKFISERKRKRS